MYHWNYVREYTSKIQVLFRHTKILRYLQYRISTNTISGKRNGVQNSGCVSKCWYGTECLTWT